MSFTYKNSGVDIEKGDKFASFISNMKSSAVNVSGGFAGGFEIDVNKYKQPVVLSCTDGVGTKLIVAQKLNKFDTIGIDLVAMSVNDLIVCGAAPQSFLDYIACSHINEPQMKALISGIVEGCEQAECILNGGETAEMPDLYKNDDFDLAGFCIGIAEKSEILPKINEIKNGDVIFGLPSTGIHSNGLSLARKIITPDHSAFPILLDPTKIYVKELKKLLKTGNILAAAHITGGGLESNTARVAPDNINLSFNWNWDVPEIFKHIQETGNVKESEMRKVFNMGIGIAIIVSNENCKSFKQTANKSGITMLEIGKVNG